MRLTALTDQKVEFNLPEVFEVGGIYHKVIGDQVVLVKDFSIEQLESLWLEPTIIREILTQSVVDRLYQRLDKIRPITEDQFQDAIHRTLNTIISE
jgi:hypothetical protein